MASLVRRGLLMTVAAGAGAWGVPAYANMDGDAAGNAVATQEEIRDIIVTARRREERVQTTPVAVSVLDGDELYRRGIKEVRDLTSSVPGVNMTQSGSSFNSIFSIRGVARGAVGNAQPAVATYLNDVPLPVLGSSVPSYDISAVQVLKGPQGTLFGRNTTAGAILIGTRKPDYAFGGYALATVGSYRWRSLEGALNIPLIDDKLALRIAGQVTRRDGYTKNLSFPGKDLDDIHRDSWRVSLRAEPVEGVENIAVFEADNIDENGTGVVFNSYTPGGTIDGIPWYNGTLKSLVPPVPCNGDIACDVRAIAALRNVEGARQARTSLTPYLTGRMKTLTNTTTVDVGPVTIKNIFGYRTVFIHGQYEVDGTALPMFDSNKIFDNKQITDELQISGQAFDGTLKYIAGAFYSNTTPNGPSRGLLQIFAISGTPFTAPPGSPPFGGPSGNGEYFSDKSKAAFAQISYDFSGLAEGLSGFSIDAGIRYTRDSEHVCVAPGQSAASAVVTPEQCPTAPLSSQSDASFGRWTYTLGANYKPTRDVMIYVVTRKGYRAGGVNTPKLGGTLVPFQTFQPEIVQDIELGVKSEWKLAGRPGLFNIAAYRSKNKGLQAGIPTSAATDPDGDGNVLNNPASSIFFGNVGDATIQGIEAELTVRPVRDLEIALGATWLGQKVDRLTIQLPGTLPASAATKEGIANAAFYGAPSYGYTADIRYTIPTSEKLGALSMSAHYYRGSPVVYGSINAEGAEKLDLRLDWRNIAQSGLDAALFVSNATNKTYPIGGALSAIGLGVNSANYNEPRMVGFQLRYTFGT